MPLEKDEFKPTQRFSARVDNYIKYRPDYPEAVLDYLQDKLAMVRSDIIADIGSGTGISTELFLKAGYKVYAIEPNDDMRNAAEKLLKEYPGFISKKGTAEATGLDNSSIGMVVAGQAFHWFNVEKARAEFIRILRPGAVAVLMWNSRKLDASPFLIAYEELLHKFGTDYNEINHKNVDKNILNSFFSDGYEFQTFENYQMFDYQSLEGRLLSSSYVPLEGEKNYQEMLEQLKKIFNSYQQNGTVKFEYSTEVYYGKLK